MERWARLETQLARFSPGEWVTYHSIKKLLDTLCAAHQVIPLGMLFLRRLQLWYAGLYSKYGEETVYNNLLIQVFDRCRTGSSPLETCRIRQGRSALGSKGAQSNAVHGRVPQGLWCHSGLQDVHGTVASREGRFPHKRLGDRGDMAGCSISRLCWLAVTSTS